MKFLSTVIIASLLLGVAYSGAAPAAQPGDGGLSLQLVQGGGKTLDQAVEQVRRQYKGRIVSAETRVSGQKETHYIKVLTEDGKVKTVTVPGRTLNNG